MYVRGLVPPMVTPLREDQGLDADAVGRVVDFLIDGGSHAVFISGTMGEFFGLTDAAREELVSASAERVAGRVPLLAGVGESSTERACRRARHASGAGADAVVALAPYYYPRYSREEIVEHLLRVRDASAVPVVIYENPHTTHLAIEIDDVMRLSEGEGFVGLKDSSGDWERFSRLTELIAPREDFFLLQGNTADAGRSVLAGADGFVPGIGNVAPRVCRALYDAAASGDEAATAKLQADVDSLRELWKDGRPVPAAKHAMELLGICGPVASSPQLPVTEAEKAQVR